MLSDKNSIKSPTEYSVIQPENLALIAEQQIALNFFRPSVVYDKSTIRFIDLFAGLGGTRLGFEQACLEKGLKSKCVFTSEIKDYAVSVYQSNFADSDISGDITTIEPESIPDFDFLLAGFPCQPFSSAGKRNGFLDERGGLFFTILDILNSKNPKGFLLENVDGLATHNSGETLKIIISKLQGLDYQVAWGILDASEFGVPQKRKRIYIVGHKEHTPNLNGFTKMFKTAEAFIEYDAPVKNTPFTKILSEKFKPSELFGKSIKDKRGGTNNIHSWDLEVKGKVSKAQKEILELILKKRRYKNGLKQKESTGWMVCH